MSCIASVSGKGDAVLRFLDDEVDDVAQVVALLVRGELAVGAGAAAPDLAGVVDLVARSEAVDDVVDELEQLVEQLPERHLGALAEVDELPVDAEARRARLVLIQQRAAVEAPSHVLRGQLPPLTGE